jgi:hypothetical protein
MLLCNGDLSRRQLSWKLWSLMLFMLGLHVVAVDHMGAGSTLMVVVLQVSRG